MQDPGDGDILCCCEYVNESGEKSHLCGLLCDCAEVDDAFDRLIRGEKWHQKQIKNICATIHDRCRLPWKGGARRVPLDSIVPFIVAPPLMWLSSFNVWAFLCINFAIYPMMFWIVYRACLKDFYPKTRFFFAWGVSNILYLFCVYEYHVVGFINLPKIISPNENTCLIIMSVLGLHGLYLVKKNAIAHFKDENDGKKSGRFCKVCNAYVMHKDHHCVWINECISTSNFVPFLYFLFMIASALFHGGLLLLTSACQSSTPFLENLILVPTNCDHYNHNFSGDPDITFFAGCQCIYIASLASLVFLTKFYVYLFKIS